MSLNTLTKMKKHELDNLKIQLTKLENRLEYLNDAKRSIERDIVTQENFIENNPEFLQNLVLFKEKAHTTINVLLSEIAKVTNEIDKHRSQIFDTFSEIKRYDLVNERREEQQLKILQKHEEAINEEIAINNFVRKEDV
jgi:flagellar biosynthesis chaperone FliJ